MPRVYTVKKARKDQGPCSRCGDQIKAGSGYLYWQFAYSQPTKRCLKPGCAPKPADLTRSEFWGTIYGLQENTFEAETIEDLESQRDEVVGELQNLASELEDKKSNMPDGLQEGDTGQLLEERAQACNDAADALESVDISFDEEDFEKPEKDEDETEEAYAKRCEEAEEAHRNEQEEKLRERLQEIAEELQSALGDISCS